MADRVAAAAMVADKRIKVTDIETRLGTRYTADTLAFSPPLIVEKAQIDRIVETVGKVIQNLE